jgi:hypothetical protein
LPTATHRSISAGRFSDRRSYICYVQLGSCALVLLLAIRAVFRLLATRTVQYVLLARMRSNTRTSSCRTFCQLSLPTPTRHPRGPASGGRAVRLLPSLSFRGHRRMCCPVTSRALFASAPPRPTAAATCSARASAAAGDFFFSLRGARERRVRVFHHHHAIIRRATAFRSRRARMRVGFPVRVAVSIGESYVRTWPRATYVSPHVEKGEQNVCADYMYTRIRSEVTVRA